MSVCKGFEKQWWAVAMEMMARTNEATGLKVVWVVDDREQRNKWERWPGTRIPSTHRSTQVEGRFGKGMPQSSLRLLT
jgi:hypothetical protein